MRRVDTPLPGLALLEPKVHGDNRGFFYEAWNRDTYRGLGIDRAWVQDNVSRSARGVLRGLHFQLARPQAKLVTVLAGEVFDVAVDVRRSSPTFGKWFSTVLSGEKRNLLYIPEGFAHGFQVLSESADFFYKVTDFWSPEDERGVAWNDPALAIPWPLAGAPSLSARDAKLPPLARQDDLPA
ncbi:MAG TPA: dTDP-4-dehydrorhamnose 3,5-epimerase [Planctomycetota bacterium]